jgi:hypothetical protein
MVEDIFPFGANGDGEQQIDRLPHKGKHRCPVAPIGVMIAFHNTKHRWLLEAVTAKFDGWRPQARAGTAARRAVQQ